MPGYNKYSQQAAQNNNLNGIYILSASAVSPQASFEQMLSGPAVYTGDRLHCIEPDYTRFVDAKLIRRMSRIIKMGVAAASEALRQADIKNPDAIITGTAYGCLADTDQFLTRMAECKETLLSPTAFIQSTHNTVAAQIALMLQCHHYNNTYVHRGSSFEAALTDALSLLEEGEATNVLLGADDEIIEKSHILLKRFGLYKPDGESLRIMDRPTKGTMAGEGAAFFIVSSQKTETVIARLVGFKNYYKPVEDIPVLMNAFLKEHNTAIEDIDLVITGDNGDSREDGHYDKIKKDLFKDQRTTTYKQFCGEYPTASAFALWMAANILKQKNYQQKEVKQLLIYNNYMLNYPAFYLLSAC
ncbi:MAG: beta-ketoacyl synthase chain length factor [Niabella sp.]